MYVKYSYLQNGNIPRFPIMQVNTDKDCNDGVYPRSKFSEISPYTVIRVALILFPAVFSVPHFCVCKNRTHFWFIFSL